MLFFATKDVLFALLTWKTTFLVMNSGAYAYQALSGVYTAESFILLVPHRRRAVTQPLAQWPGRVRLGDRLLRLTSTQRERESCPHEAACEQSRQAKLDHRHFTMSCRVSHIVRNSSMFPKIRDDKDACHHGTIYPAMMAFSRSPHLCLPQISCMQV